MSAIEPGFERRWRVLASAARGASPAVPSLADLAQLAREGELEAAPLLSRRATHWLCAAAAAVTIALAPHALVDSSGPGAEESARLVPPPPSLPPPPGLESPSYYLARVDQAWKELAP